MFGYKAQTAFFANANIGIQDAQIVQVDQALKFLRPIQVGDKLYCDVYVHSVRQAHGTDIIVTKNIITNRPARSCRRPTPPLRGVAKTTERVASAMALREFSSVKVGDELAGEGHSADPSGPGQLRRRVR